MTKVQLGNIINDRYELLEPLGYGGMAHVYRAKDIHLGREVAVKILRPSLIESDQARFLREIRTLAQLSHPNVVSIYDLGTGTKGTSTGDEGLVSEDVIYFVMELVDGGPVTELGPFEVDLEPALALIDTAICMAKALAYVHRQGIIHRDLTPHNILRNARGDVKIMDFGLVHLAEASRLTRTGRTLGTPQYMAPEQAKGEPLDAKADLYALGAVLFHMLTGGPPFAADSDQAVLYQHVYETLNMPHEINPHVPVSLSHIVAKLLNKRPHARHHSGDAVADALLMVRAELLQRSGEQRLGGGGQRGVIAGGVVRPDALTPRWRTTLEDGMQWPSALTAAEGFVLAGLRSEQVAVIHPDNGQVLTTFDAEDEINSPLSYHHGLLSYVSRSGGLYAVTYPDGLSAWRDPNAGAVGALALGRWLVVATRQGLELRDHITGKRQWQHQFDAAASPPTLHHEHVYITTHTGWLHAVHLTTGKSLFKIEVGLCRAQPSAGEHILLIPEHTGDLHALDLDTFEVLWTYDLEKELWASPLIWQGRAYAVSWAGTMHCLDLRTGDTFWETDLHSPVTASPILAGGCLYTVTETGELVVLDAYSGTCYYRHQVSNCPCQASPLVFQGRVLVVALDGTLQAYAVPYA